MWFLVPFLLLCPSRFAHGAPCTETVPAGLAFCSELNTADTIYAEQGVTAPVLDTNARRQAALISGSSSCSEPYDADSCADSSLSSDPACVAALKTFTCHWNTAPARDWTLGLNCDDATIETPSESMCDAVFTSCGYDSVLVVAGGSPMDQATLCDPAGPLDFQPPVISNCVDVTAFNNTATVVDYKVATSGDADSGVANEAYSPDKAAGEKFSTGSTAVTFTSTDNAGNKADCMFNVVVGVCTNSTDCQNGATCIDSICQCTENYFGPVCEDEKVFCPGDSTCQGKGNCDFATGTCQCFGGWSGPECEQVACPVYDEKTCNDRGICHPVGVCQCDMGWIGAICQIRIEDNGMSGGQLAAAVIGGLLFSFFFLVMLFAYVGRDQSIM